MAFFGTKTLQDMVKGIRNAGNDGTAYTSRCIQDIKEELKNRDLAVKTQALQKLIYVSAARWRAR
jgi:AP-3 complex subunit delta-1